MSGGWRDARRSDETSDVGGQCRRFDGLFALDRRRVTHAISRRRCLRGRNALCRGAQSRGAASPEHAAHGKHDATTPSRGIDPSAGRIECKVLIALMGDACIQHHVPRPYDMRIRGTCEVPTGLAGWIGTSVLPQAPNLGDLTGC
jgi:hypothetical protein